MENFKGLGLPASLADALDKMQFTTPTPIQAQAIPLALAGKDVLGTAQTGTGKTAAFAIPMITKLINSPECAALILTPTRELAAQVLKMTRGLLNKSNSIETALIIGGESIYKQNAQLKRRPRIIVGTPGRINDHLTRGSLKIKNVAFLVLDETDRMLDMGFSVQLDKIIKYLPKERQTLMFSATLPRNILKLSEKYLYKPERVAVGSTSLPAIKIKQEVIHTSPTNKYADLLKELDVRKGSVIIFVKTKRGAQKLSDKLNREERSADTIHGDLQQRRRDRVITAFREQKHRIMVATDVAARGLDIPHIAHVINYDLPQCPEDYIHRIGRTARAGAEGSALCMICPEDNKKWRAISKLIGGKVAVKGNAQPDEADNQNLPSYQDAGKKRYKRYRPKGRKTRR